MGTRVESTALATKTQNFTNGGSNGKGKDKPMCTHCGKLGHTIDKCYKLHGFPSGYKTKNKSMAHLVSFPTLDQPHNHMAMTPQESVPGYVTANTPAPSLHHRSVPTAAGLNWCITMAISATYYRAGVPHGQYCGFP